MNPGKPEQRMQQNLYPQSLTGSSSVCERTPEKPSHSLPVIRPFFHWANMCWYTPDAEHPVKWGEWNWMPCSYSEGLVVCERETFSSVQPLSHVWLRPHWSQHTRLPCPSPTPRACSHSCPSHWWGHPNISSSVVPFPSCLQSFPESESFPMSQFVRWPKYWSFSFSIRPSIEYSGLISFRMDWLDLLAVQGTLKSLLQHHSWKISIVWCSAFFIVQLSHPYMTTGKTIALTRQTFVNKVMSQIFNMLSSLVITFLPRSKCLLISWLQSPSAVILEPKKIKSLSFSIVSPSVCHEVMGPDAMILVFWMLSFNPAFSLSSFTFIKRFFRSSSLSAIRVVSFACLRLSICLPAILIPVCASSSPAFCLYADVLCI